jgi:hypothetical protein
MARMPEPLPGPVPDDQNPKWAWPTWREALIDAFEGVGAAYDRRRRIAQAAFDAGLTFRQIGEAVGMSAAGVQKIIGRQRNGDLDAPAFQSRATGAEDA